MPANSLDTFANTNPAFCALILRAFVDGHIQIDDSGLPLPFVVLPLPVVLSADIANTFAGTNSSTGLLTWIGRHPSITIELRRRIEASARFSREALLFGITRRVLGVNDRGRVVLDDEGLTRKVRFPADEDRGRAVSNARQFGRWLAGVRSIETVFACLGLNR
jgi:hypothetical protein